MSIPTPQLLLDTLDNRTRIINAARELAIESGYDSVEMAAIARRANVGRTTLYRYYPTKECVYADATLRWGYEFAKKLSENFPQGRTVGARIKDILIGLVVEAETNLNLIAAQVSCSVSRDRNVREIYKQTNELIPNLLNMAMGDIRSQRQALTNKVLSDLILSNYILLSTGAISGKAIIKELVQVAELLLDDVWDKPIA